MIKKYLLPQLNCPSVDSGSQILQSSPLNLECDLVVQSNARGFLDLEFESNMLFLDQTAYKI